MTLAPPDSTLNAIRTKVRRLIASPSEQSLATDTIDQAINTFYTQDFPYAIKLDQMRSVYTFFTSPNVDRYPINVNFNQGIRAPIYFEGIKGMFFKDRDQFFNMWPRWPTQSTLSSTTLTGSITNATQSNPCILTADNTLLVGAEITISDVVGMTELNGNTYTVTAVTGTTITINVDSSAFTPYISDGTYTSSSQTLIFTIQNTPFLSQSFVLGGTDINGLPIRIGDDGNGNLYYYTPNPVVLNPSYTNPNPGMKNSNLSGTTIDSGETVQLYPGDLIPIYVGTINYVTGVGIINFNHASVTPEAGSTFNVWISQYAAGRPYTMMFWNNEFTIRPVPDNVYKVEVETYMTPVQFLEAGGGETTASRCILDQWWQYIAYGVAMEIQRERNDFDSVDQLREGFMRQEALVLERQGVEEIGQRNATIFSSSIPQQGWNQGFGWPY